VKSKVRWTVVAHDFYTTPEDTTGMAGTEGFHRRLFGGKARGKGRGEVAFAPAIGDFTFGEHTADEPVTVALNGCRDARNLSRVQTRTYNVHSQRSSYMTLPQVSETFTWNIESWGPALRCTPLAASAPHLFTSRQLQLSTAADWQQVAGSLDVANVITLTQVHGRAVVVVRRDRAVPAGRPDGDALISDRPDVAIAVRAADCVPLLLADSRTRAVGAVHAGWRGTVAGVARAAVDAMQREFRSNPSDLVAAIGPAIGVCCYEVGSELVDAFAQAGYSRSLVDRWFLAQPHRRGVSGRAKLHLDVIGANRDQLTLAGVPADSIHVAGLCTAMHLDVLTSYRAEGEKAGRLVGAIRAPAPD
jgi:YfiH family protein